MPTVVCPGCQKQYKLPETAAGQVASCKCGKRFRVGSVKPGDSAPASSASQSLKPTAAPVATSSASVASKPAPAAPKPVAAPRSTLAATPTARPTAAPQANVKDDFWDDNIPQLEPPTPLAPAAAPRGVGAANSLGDRRRGEEPESKKMKRASWGFDWGKVGGGLMTFVVCGAITVGLAIATDRIFIWPAVVAVGGLFTALSGLLGRDGVY